MFNAKTWHMGEELAARYLTEKNYRIVARNAKLSGAEVDIIAVFPAKQEIKKYKDLCKCGKLDKFACDNLAKNAKDTLVFVEVKSRGSKEFGNPEQAVTSTKIAHIKRFAQSYVKQKRLTDVAVRFDVIAVTGEGKDADICHIENAF